MSNPHHSISAVSFYGRRTREHITLTETLKCSDKDIEKFPFKYLSPETPSSTWQVFRKQKDALEFAEQRMNDVMTFVCQNGTCGERQFLVAPPHVFWFYDCKKVGQRCSYEIIVEHALCKLYFDLEFSKELNRNHDGIRMTDTFIKVVAHILLKEWNIVCTREHVLDLDSSTDKKFSRHLIYQLPGAIFQDNYHVGCFVRQVCDVLRSIKDEGVINDMSLEIKYDDLLELFIDNKGKQKLFCDEAVYSKNRHFRLYCSSKWNKNSSLLRSKENRWLTNASPNDEKLFLDSLITYSSNDKHYFAILQYTNASNTITKTSSLGCSKVYYPSSHEKASPFPDIDRFIQQIVVPGKIYRWCYSSSRNHLFYDIVGNRYCRNIGREHRSNNIRFIVEIGEQIFYQKCYDPDCRDYCSERFMLPPEFMFTLEGSILFKNVKDSDWENNFPEDELGEVLDCIESNFITETNH